MLKCRYKVSGAYDSVWIQKKLFLMNALWIFNSLKQNVSSYIAFYFFIYNSNYKQQPYYINTYVRCP